jgi:hypothetical protein
VAFNVPTEVVGVDKLRNMVLAKMDRTHLYGHLQECAKTHPLPDDAEATHSTELAQVHEHQDPHLRARLVGRVEQFLRGGFFMAKGGSRACTMCGVHGEACVKRLPITGKACCPACGDGNTHPAPGEAEGTCAAWAAEHGAQD